MERPAGKPSDLPDLSEPVVIGVITTPHGVRGTVRVRPTGSGGHLREGLAPLAGDRRRRILDSRETPKGFLIDLEGITDREAASSLRGVELALDESELDSPEDGEFYVSRLVGLAAFDESGAEVGTVTGTFETAAHEVLVISRGETETYVPFTFEHVPDLDVESRRMTVRPPRE